MGTRARIRAVAACGVLAAAAVALSPAVADPSTSLTAEALEQVVLRAQMPRTLGAWRQQQYHALPGAAPYVCLTGVGGIELLPRARELGTVAYTVGSGARGEVSVFQYSSPAAAASALEALRRAECPSSPKVEWGDGPLIIVDAIQSSRFTTDARVAIEATVRFPDPLGVRTYEHRLTTQHGLAVIQTSVGLASGSATSTNERRAARLDRLWHQQVLRAYEAFASGSSH